MEILITAEKAREALEKLAEWKLDADKKIIYREYTMKNFLAAVDLVNRIAGLAEAANHHPDLHLTGYRLLRVELSTHSAGGLTDKDFSLAAAINGLPAGLPPHSYPAKAPTAL